MVRREFDNLDIDNLDIAASGGMPALMEGAATCKPDEDGVVLTAELDAVISTDVAAGEILKVEAAAGSGKSTALRLYAARRPQCTTLYLTFTAAEAREKAADYKRHGLDQVTVSTLHALAFAATHDLHHGSVQDTLALSASQLARLTNSSTMDWPAARRAGVRRVLECFVASDADDLRAQHVEAALESGGLLDAARAVWRAACAPESGLPLTHDMYLKICCVRPERRATMFAGVALVLLDEAHDCTPAQLSLALARRDCGWGAVVVFDFRQRIYGWRRAATESYLRAIDAIACIRLSSTWRFGGSLASVVSRLLRHHASDSLTIEGSARCSTEIREVARWPLHEVCGRACSLTVLARTRATLFAHAMDAMASDVEMAISIGGEDPAGAFAMFGGRERLLDTFALFQGRPSHAMLVDDGAAQFVELGFNAYRAAAESAGLRTAMEACAAVECYGSALPGLIRKLDKALHSNASCKLVLLSVHEAKGGEWPHVYVSDELRQFSGLSHEEHAYRLNLVYVAMTRATRVLFLPTPVVTSWLSPARIVILEFICIVVVSKYWS